MNVGYLNVDDLEEQRSVRDAYDDTKIRRGKVCEVTATRAISRPHAGSFVETIPKALNVVKQLSGILPPPLSLKMKAITGTHETAAPA